MTPETIAYLAVGKSLASLGIPLCIWIFIARKIVLSDKELNQ